MRHLFGKPMPAQNWLLKKRLSASTYEPWLEQPNYPPGALTYIKGNRRIDVDLRVFLAATPGKRAIHWFPEPDAGR
ncbi:MAG: hypothetical protein ACHP82_08675 [Hyphomicrobiales bacterium]